MGCDIHFYVEKKQDDGSWKLVWPQLVSARDELEEELEDSDMTVEDYPGLVIDGGYEELSKYWDEQWNSPLSVGRNYDLFAMLANVRNGYGFAGVDTGDGFKVIDEPRGIPENASAAYRWEAERWGVDGHSHSYFTLRELLEWEGWDYETHKRGVVGPTGYMQWKVLGAPSSWCGGVSGNGVRNVSNEEMQLCLDTREVTHGDIADTGWGLDQGAKVYTQVQWTMKYRESAVNFLENVLPAMQELGDLDEIRAVFFFDN